MSSLSGLVSPESLPERARWWEGSRLHTPAEAHLLGGWCGQWQGWDRPMPTQEDAGASGRRDPQPFCPNTSGRSAEPGPGRGDSGLHCVGLLGKSTAANGPPSRVLPLSVWATWLLKLGSHKLGHVATQRPSVNPLHPRQDQVHFPWSGSSVSSLCNVALSHPSSYP